MSAAGHDPLCPHYQDHTSRVYFNCQCALIAEVRTEERGQSKALALAAYDRGYTVADNGGDPDVTHVDALIAQTRSASSHYRECPMRQCEHDRVWCEHECHCDTIDAVRRRWPASSTTR